MTLMMLTTCHLEKIADDTFTPSFNIVNNGCAASCEISFENTTESSSSQEWHFSDTSLVLSGTTATRRYQFPGLYQVTLYVWNNRGVKDSLTKDVNVTATSFEAFSSAYAPGEKAIQLPDGTYVVVGTKPVANSTFTDVYLIGVNVDQSGEITTPLFSKTFDIAAFDEVNDMVLLSDGTIAIIGTASGQGSGYRDSVFYIRTNTLGDKISGPKKLAFSPSNNRGLGIAEAPDGSVMITGQSTDGTNADVFLAKYKSDLTVKYFPNPVINLPGYDSGVDVTLADDGGYFVAGTTSSGNSAQTDVILLKLNATGGLVSGFPKTFGTPTNYENTKAVTVADDGTVVIVGLSNKGSGDIYLIGTTQNGVSKSGYPLTLGDASLTEEGFDVVVSDGNYVIAGYKNVDAHLLKVNANGLPIGSGKTFGGAGFDYFKSIETTHDGGFILTGGKNDVLYLVKTKKDF